MVTEDYVSFETAKLLKEKGFDEYGMYFYTLKDKGREGYKSNKRLGEFAHNSDPDLKDRVVSCPTLQMAMKWLREKYSLEIYPYHDNTTIYSSKWWFEIIEYPNTVAEYESGKDEEFDTYEKACEAAIKYCLENLI